jgi:hypothetical protein
MSNTLQTFSDMRIAGSDGMPFVSFGGGADGVAAEEREVGGIKIKAFRDASRKLLFVLDTTRDSILPNVLLVIDGKDDRKWDDILENDFRIDPETVRPRANNKYQRLDIDYDGLGVYSEAMFSNDAEELRKWRLAAAEKQKYFRMAEAERELELARATIGEARKTIAGLDEFIALQKDKLKAAKKNLGKEPPKDSAAKILRYEARIERAEAKKARSARRLKRAERRIDSNGKILDNYRNTVIPKGRVMNDDNDVKPLFTENPNIIDTDNAFKPVSFGPPPISEPPVAPSAATAPAEAPVAYTPQQFVPPAAPAMQPIRPAVERPAAPMTGDLKIAEVERKRGQSGAYYLMLTLLIGLSIFTLYLYQKKMGSVETPHIAATATETITPEPTRPEIVVNPEPQREVADAAPTMPTPIPENISDSLPADDPFIAATASVPETVEPIVEAAPEVAMEPEPPQEIEVAAETETVPEPVPDEVPDENTLDTMPDATPETDPFIEPPAAAEPEIPEPVQEETEPYAPEPDQEQEYEEVFNADDVSENEPDEMVFESEQFSENMEE